MVGGRGGSRVDLAMFSGVKLQGEWHLMTSMGELGLVRQGGRVLGLG